MRSQTHTTILIALMASLLCACNGSTGDEYERSFEYPLDDLLRFNHIQAKGTHNSYHLRSDADLPEWNYSHAPLDTQLREHGARQFELDVYYNEVTDSLDVYHIPVFDDLTTCPTLMTCLQTIKTWSAANPAHHPIVVMLEIKASADGENDTQLIDLLNLEVATVFNDGEIITPDEIQRDASSLREAVEDLKWPHLEQLRGRVLFFLNDTGEFRDVLTHQGTSLSGRSIFPDGGGDLNWQFAAIHAINNPTSERLIEAVQRGHLVRTMTDPAPREIDLNDHTGVNAALANGAHFLSTDYPSPVEGVEFWVEIPDGTPSRCNPITAPAECTAKALENPEFIN